MQTIKNTFSILFKDTNPVRERLLGLGATMNGLIKVKLGRPMLKVLLLLPPVIGLKRNLSLIKVTITYLAYVHRLYKGGSMRFVIVYLKACHTLLQQFLGGQRLSDTGPFGARVSRTRGGLPRVIPVLHRKRIQSGDLLIIRYWLSLFCLYRILDMKGVLNLRTIVEPSTANPKVVADFSEFVPIFWSGLKVFLGRTLVPIVEKVAKGGPIPILSLLEAKPELLSKSAPVVSDAALEAKMASTSPQSILLTSRVWMAIMRTTELGKAFKRWCTDTNNIWLLRNMDSWSRGALDPRSHNIGVERRSGKVVDVSDKLIAKMLANAKKKWPVKLLNVVYRQILGKLGTKVEPAGKVRVFAMVDPFTQWLLRPLHDALFSLFRQIRQDGTHNQVKPLIALIKEREVLIKENRYPGSRPTGWVRLGLNAPKRAYALFSFDLTAATDRLPLAIQVALLGPVLGPRLAKAWASLLVARDYYIYLKDEYGVGSLQPQRYATGQPMGALSSWAMLALTHHCIVQWAWYKVCTRNQEGWSWYRHYAVLGDDIVIMGGRVADAYVAIMKGLGVQIGAHKSLVSRDGTCLEFAKRTFYKGNDVSAVSLAELLVSRKNLSAGLELCRKYGMGLGAYAKFLGYGYKATGSLTKRLWSLPARLRNYLVAYHGPSMSLFQGVLPWLTMRSLQSTYKVTEGALLKAKELLLGPEVKEVLSRIDRIVKELCEPFDPDNFEKQGHLIPHGSDLGRLPYHPGLKGVPKDVLWLLDNVVYKDPFVQAMEAVQTLRARVTALGDGVIDHLPELWSALQEIEEQIGAIPSMGRLTAAPNLNRLGEGLKLIRRWERLSRPFRSTTK